MKINKILLKGYNQFKDLEIDLTYPAGHEKAGQPLDKVCFIGQSGTGKTSLLRLIKYFVTNDNAIGTGVKLSPLEEGMVKMNMSFNDFIFLKDKNPSAFYIYDTLNSISTDGWFEKWKNEKTIHYSTNKPILINFPTERLVSKNEDTSNESVVSI